ncbi:MAG TPA: hypothetical protein VIC51_10775, partial [Psychromonas sp.]
MHRSGKAGENDKKQPNTLAWRKAKPKRKEQGETNRVLVRAGLSNKQRANSMSEIRNLAAGLVHAAMQDGISEVGEKE